MHQGIEVIPIGVDELRVLCLAVRGDLTAHHRSCALRLHGKPDTAPAPFSPSGQLILLIQNGICVYEYSG